MKTVVITGGNGDIAQAIAAKLRERGGYEVFTPGRSEMDVTSIESVSSYLAGKKPDILVNNAGYVVPQSIREADVAKDQASLSINLFGTFNCTAAVLKLNPKAQIINVGSSAATKIHGTWSAYCAAKAAVVMATKCWAEDGVNTICISPGRTATKMRTSLYPVEDQSTLLKPDEFATIVMYAIDGRYQNGEHINVTRQNVEELINAQERS